MARWQGPALMVTSAATWAAGLIFTKLTLDVTEARPTSVLFVQLVASVAVLLVAGLATGADLSQGWRKGWVGLLEPGISYQLALAGLALTSAANASVLGSLEPVLVPILAWLLLRERPHPRLIIVILGATVGSVLVSYTAGGNGGAWHGDALIVASVVAAALYVVVASKQVADVKPLPAALSQQTWALGLIVLVLGGQIAFTGGPFWPEPTATALFLAGLSGVLNYALPFWLYLSALTRMPVSRAATYLTLIPVFGVLLSVVVLRESVTWLDVLGGALVVVALFVDAVASARADRKVAVRAEKVGTMVR